MSQSDVPPQPEPCLTKPCRSRIACFWWGYCRERNLRLDHPVTEAEVAEFRKIAKEASR